MASAFSNFRLKLLPGCNFSKNQISEQTSKTFMTVYSPKDQQLRGNQSSHEVLIEPK